MARGRRAVAGSSTARRGRKSTRSANVAENLGPAMSSPDPTVVATPAKRTPRKAAPRGKWSEQQLLTSEKSVLIDSDLVKLLASSAAWNCLEEDEKRQILALLPEDVHPEVDLQPEDPNAKIPPLPESFVRYSNNWRDGIRQFQLDLQHGRYDPEWLHQAEEARKERENGDFDSFKDREFEEFWGQKQKMDMKSLAGESGRVKLGDLVDAGVILLGDVWRFTFVFGRGEGRVVIDKEAWVHDIHNSKLTFKIAPGQRVFPRNGAPAPREVQAPEKAAVIKQEETTAAKTEETEKQTTEDYDVKEAELEEHVKEEDAVKKDETHENGLMEDIEEEDTSDNLQNPAIAPPDLAQPRNETVQVVISTSPEKQKRPASPNVAAPLPKRKRGRPRKEPALEVAEQENANTKGEDLPSDPTDLPMETSSPLPVVESSTATDDKMDVADSSQDIEQENPESSKNMKKERLEQVHPEPPISDSSSDLSPLSSQSSQLSQPSQPSPPSQPSQPVAEESDDIIVSGIKSPLGLVKKILEIDGRKKEGRSSNAWKEIRCYRKNQDMGTLWEVRQTWYLKQT